MDSNELLEYFKKAVEDLKSAYKEDIKFKADHISLLTESSEDYEKALGEYRDFITDHKEIPHSGRRLTVATLKTPIIENGYTLERLEICEPKPRKPIAKRRINHMSFVPENFEEFLKYSTDHKIDIYDVMKIGSVTICKWKAPNTKLEFRSSTEYVLNDKETTNTKASNVDEVEKYKREAEENKEKALRALADYQNLKKRMEADREAFQFVANTALIAKLLDISDDFFRADEFVQKEEDHSKVKSAYKSVLEKISGVISDFGLVEVPVSIGDRYDMHSMEAIGTVVTDKENENDTVKHIAAKGYKYSNKEQVIRPARVIVAKYNPEKEEV